MQKNNTLILAVFLLGIFMGAIDIGIVSPAREIVQNDFGVSRHTGMWIITIYSLSYAISMPIVSKMADRYGHKKVYSLSIVVFGIGSLFCGLSNYANSFSFLLVSRVVQATGAGGIMPIATTVIGQSFPEERRGMAMGLVGAIHGVASIIGPTLGSTILAIAGSEHWGYLFFINVPISIAIVMMSTAVGHTQTNPTEPLDVLGAFAVAGVIGSLMYALTHMDFYHILISIRKVDVFPALIIFALLIPILIWAENRAADPILNLKYFKDRQMLATFILAFIVGLGMMGVVFVPQFAENILKMKAGTGGYLVTLVAFFSGIAAPLSGKLVDTKGPRITLGLGFLFMLLGSLYLGYITVNSLSFTSLAIGLILIGFGMGFTLGSPLSYLVLQNTSQEDVATAMATMSLIRSIGVTISPSILVGFIADAGKELPNNLAQLLAQMSFEITNMTALVSGRGHNVQRLASLQNADVTTIVDMLQETLAQLVPPYAQDTMVQGIENMRDTIEVIFQTTLNKGYTNMFTAAALIAGIGLLISFLLREQVPSQRNQEKTLNS